MCGSWYTSCSRRRGGLSACWGGRGGKGSGLQAGQGPGRGWGSHVVVQKEGDPVRGVVQEQQPLQEAGQERGGLFHEHGQQHPGGRLGAQTAELRGEPRPLCPSALAGQWVPKSSPA